jgi:hypothetical protein
VDELAADLGAVSGPVGELLGEARNTLAVGESASSEITGAIEAFDELMERFDDSRDSRGPAAETDAPPGKPFDVTEYGAAAARIGTAAQELTTLLVELDERLPEARVLLDETAARGTATVDRALRGLLLVGLALIAAAALVAWLVRRRTLARRFEPAGHPAGG